MSTPNPTHTIAEHHVKFWSKSADDSYALCWCRDMFDTIELHAEHVVSKLTDAGYSIVQLPTVVGECEDKYPLSDPPLLCQRVSGHPGIHEAVDASDDRFVWPNLDPATSTCRHCWEPIDHSDGRWRHTENGFGMLTCGSAYQDAGGNYYFAAPAAPEGEKP